LESCAAGFFFFWEGFAASPSLLSDGTAGEGEHLENVPQDFTDTETL